MPQLESRDWNIAKLYGRPVTSDVVAANARYLVPAGMVTSVVHGRASKNSTVPRVVTIGFGSGAWVLTETSCAVRVSSVSVRFAFTVKWAATASCSSSA